MNLYYGDLHLHIGRSKGRPVKVTASAKMTIRNIAEECIRRKGINLIGLVDCLSPSVLEEIKELIERGYAVLHPRGGIIYREKLLIIPGAEVEVPCGRGNSHWVAYFPSMDSISRFAGYMAGYIKNIYLSTQKARIDLLQLIDRVVGLGGIIIPVHIFTPHRSFYGVCGDSFGEVLGKRFDLIPAVELGLSADTYLADHISQLEEKVFLSNSDAHSLSKIGREYNQLAMEELCWEEFIFCLKRERGRSVASNYGLDPRLGKYYRTFCCACGARATTPPPVGKCLVCGSSRVVPGVLDRIYQIKDRETSKSPSWRPPYHHQIPLEFIPGVGRKVLEKLLDRLGTEMEVLHRASCEDIAGIVGEELAGRIEGARTGRFNIEEGGGGFYGKLRKEM